MKVLIFGASGFVGPYLAKEFEEHGYEVIGTDIKETNAMSFKFADILDVSSVERVVRETAPDMIVNLAAISSVGQSWNFPQITVSVNVIGALNILEAARRLDNSPKILFVGSSEEYEASDKPISEKNPLNANNPYGISKAAQERFAKIYRERFGIKIYCVRPFNHTGPGQSDSFVLSSFCKQVAEIEKSGKSGVIKVGNLSPKRDFSHVKDIVRAYRMILETDDCEMVYNVGSGMVHSLSDMLDYILKLSRKEITVEIDPKRFRPVDTPVICCNNSLIRENLGWKPQLSVFDALREMYEYRLENNKVVMEVQQ